MDQAIGREQERRIAVLERALDAKGEQITAIQHQRDSMGETIAGVAGLEQEATRLADELACERERHHATLAVGLGLSDELRVETTRRRRAEVLLDDARADLMQGQHRREAQRTPLSDDHDADLEAWTTRPSLTTHRLVPERARGAAEPVPLGPSKKGKACTWRPPADIVVGREDVPRGEQRSGYVAVERKEER